MISFMKFTDDALLSVFNGYATDKIVTLSYRLPIDLSPNPGFHSNENVPS